MVALYKKKLVIQDFFFKALSRTEGMSLGGFTVFRRNYEFSKIGIYFFNNFMGLSFNP